MTEFGAQACEAHQQFGSKAVAAARPEQIELLRDWLQAVAPDCDEIVPIAEGWNCKMRTENASIIREELAGVRSTMITRWTRSPYLLARRIAVAMHLADVLLSPNFEAELARQCRIIRNSLDIELPATIASQTWQKAACDGASVESVRAVVNIGLTKAMAEIDLLRQLFERSNRQGYLNVRIPDAPGGSLWVTLSPSDQTSSVLVAEAQALYLEKIGGPPPEQSKNAPKACWHPIYGENSAILTLARHLDLAGDTAKAYCEDLELPAEHQPERYLAESIASESEFVVNNGRAKMLRLPKGRYSYRLQVLPKDPNDWDNAASSVPESTGEFDWTEARPRPQITHW
jgi:hypothetical protein